MQIISRRILLPLLSQYYLFLSWLPELADGRNNKYAACADDVITPSKTQQVSNHIIQQALVSGKIIAARAPSPSDRLILTPVNVACNEWWVGKDVS